MLAISDTAIVGTQVAIVALAAVILGRKIGVNFRNVKFTLGSIDHSVNGRGIDEPSLSDDMTALRAELQTDRELALLRHHENCHRLDAIEARLKE